jgi:hypothetical protein
MLSSDANLSKWNIYQDTGTKEIWMGSSDGGWMKVANNLDDLITMYK